MMKFTNDYVLTEVGDSVMAVPIGDNAEKTRHIVRLNDTGAVIWHGIEKGQSPEEIANTLVKEYGGIDTDAALRHVEALVEKLVKAGILSE